MREVNISEQLLFGENVPFIGDEINKKCALVMWKIFVTRKTPLTSIVAILQKLMNKENINGPALRSALERMNLKQSKLRGEKKINFLSKTFEIPILQTDRLARHPKREMSTQELTSASLAKELHENKMKFSRLIDNMAQKDKLRIGKNSQLRQQLKQAKRKIDRAKARLLKRNSKSTENHKLLFEQEKRKTKKLEGKIVKLHSKNLKFCKLKSEIAQLKRKNAALKKEVSLTKSEVEFVNTKVSTLGLENTEKQKKIETIERDRSFLSSIVEHEGKLILTENCAKLQYTSDTNLMIMKLLQCGIATDKVAETIKTVSTFCGKTPDHLPSRQTVDAINLRRLAIAQEQVGEVQKSCSNQTLYSDEYSKLGEKVIAFAVTTSDQTPLVMGLKPIPTKSAEDTLECFSNLVNEISTSCGNPDIGKRLVVNIKNTMSDRASTEKKFNELLLNYRSKFLPTVIVDFNSKPAEEQRKLHQMNNFFCGLHLLVSLADNSQNTLLTYEKQILHESIGARTLKQIRAISNTESNVFRMVRTSCKLFARGADEKSGCFRDFTTYLKSHNVHNSLVPFRHNRFNIVFYNSAQTYYLANHMLEFLSNIHGTPNLLCQAVLADLKEPWCLSGSRALGLICKAITSPLWRILEDPTITIATVAPIYQEIVHFLEELSTSNEKIADFVKGEYVPEFFATKMEKDIVWQCLTSPSAHDAMTIDILKQIFTNWVSLLTRLVKDHLEGGMYDKLPLDQAQATASVVKHNKLSEELFGRLDRLMRMRPVATLITNEAHIVFGKNRTLQWLQKKSLSQQRSIISRSRKRAMQLKKQARNTLYVIASRRLQKQTEKQRELTKKKDKAFKAKNDLTSKIIDFGLWQTEDQVRDKLADIVATEGKATGLQVLKYQILFRKNVLQQPVTDKKVFAFSSKANGNSTVEDLTKNLNTLISSASTLVEAGEGSQERFLLVNKKVKHRFEIEEGIYEWFEGRVISSVPGFPQWFNIVYDGECDSVYTYKLLEDQSSGDLEIIPEY